MSLKENLERTREKIEAKASPQALAAMHRSIDELRSTILGSVLGAGEPMPRFALEGQGGKIVDSRALLARGPLVVTFYRGRW